MAYGEDNTTVHNEIEALAEKLGYGVLDLSMDLHNKRITAITVFGKQRNRYAKDNPKALQDIADRLAKSITNQETTQLTFVVKVRNGNVEETMWLSNMTRKYDK